MPKLITLEEVKGLSNPFITSRSAVECYQTCQRKRWLEYFFAGKGIRPTKRNVPLLTGTTVHTGVEVLMNQWLDGRSIDIDRAVEIALQDYWQELQSTSFLLNTPTTKHITQQHADICEALIRIWGLVELPMLQRYYDIVTTEQEMIIQLSDNPVMLMPARIDATLLSKDIGSGRQLYNYSLKTCKEFYFKIESSYKIDLQTLTEAYAANYYFSNAWNRVTTDKSKYLSLVDEYFSDNPSTHTKLVVAADKYFDARLPNLPNKVSGTKFCYLVKGKLQTDKESGLKYIDNPLVNAYRNIGLGDITYAHSYYFPNSENKSGRSRLGKNWESFIVSKEYEGGIPQWILDLYKGYIQPDAGKGTELLRKWCISPTEYYREPLEVQSAMAHIVAQETRIKRDLVALDRNQLFPLAFVPNFRSCYWSSSNECNFIPLCHQREWFTGKAVPPIVLDDPIGSGWYETRVPHHPAELVSMDMQSTSLIEDEEDWL